MSEEEDTSPVDVPVQLRRDLTPVLVCACGHCDVEHNCDLQAQPCRRSGCGCRTLRVVQRRWRVHGWIVEAISQAG